MLSRRNVRIKVMQMLYAMSRDNRLKLPDLLKGYRERINQSFQLYLFNLLYLIRLTQYAEMDAERRHAKLLPTEEDLKFTPKLCRNDLIASLLDNEKLNALFKHYKLENCIDKDTLRLIYTEFAKQPDYLAYALKDNITEEEHKEMFLILYRHCIQSETFNEIVEDFFPQWVDDKTLIVGALKKTIKALPVNPAFFEEYRPNAETTQEFGEALLSFVCESDDELLELIEPTLKNWDAERVAVIDMILLKMAISELINFPTIPSKVTLNEFVEISKLYSTEKSKDFINGILDRLMKKLDKEGRIKKKGRGLQE